MLKITRSICTCFAITFILILLCAWLGILTRPLAHAAFFWPANACLLGLLLRFPHFRHPATFVGAALGYMSADLSTGLAIFPTLALTVANLISISLAYLMFKYLRQMMTKETENFYIKPVYPYLLSTLIASAVAAGFVILCLPHLPNTFMGEPQGFADFLVWWSGEMFNYIIVLPLVLTFPKWQEIKAFFTDKSAILVFKDIQHLMPLFAVLIACVITNVLFAPGAMLYPLAAMMWAAAVYSMFSIAIISALVCLTLFHSLSFVYLHDNQDNFLFLMISIRIGLSILAITTLCIGIMSLNRKKMFNEMAYLADHDSLTGAMNRRSFMRYAEHLMMNKAAYPIAMLMLDIDHFKRINDNYGHYGGDRALQHFAQLVKKNLRDTDGFCRLGGEEFVILLQEMTLADSLAIAERIRLQLEQQVLAFEGLESLTMTVSIGVIFTEKLTSVSLDDLLMQADIALYDAKHAGRNQIQLKIA